MITFSRLGNYGRLGNQLFQIASTIGIATKNNQPYCFPEWKYQKHFNNPLPMGYLENAKEYTEPDFTFYDVELAKGNWDLVGYFQSWKYFDHYQDLVRHYFKFPTEKKEGVAVHVRRGDFLERAAYHTNLNLSYYTKAMNEFNGGHFTIFSDDIDWCKESIIGSNISYYPTGDDIHDLKAMSEFSGFIIANSSYSWWAAWLSGSDKVIAPKNWFEVPINTKDLYLPNWTII